MNELFKKIYESVICYEEDVIQMGAELDKEIDSLISNCDASFDAEEIETIKTLMYQAILSAEQTGFYLGVKYAVKMLLELLSNR